MTRLRVRVLARLLLPACLGPELRMNWAARVFVPLLAAGSLAAAETPVKIPLCPGLQIVTAVSQANGDYESIKTVESANDMTVRMKYSAEQLVTDSLAADFGAVRNTTVHRSLRREDLKAATLYQQRFFEGMPETIPETSAVGVSSAVLVALKTTGKADLSISNAYSGEFPADRKHRPNLYDFMTKAQLGRVEPKPVMLPVVVNDAKVLVPAIHARGDFAGEAAEFFFLDDEANPLTLKFRIGIDAVAPMNKETIELCNTMKKTSPDLTRALCGRTTAGDREVLQVVKVSYRCSSPVSPQVQPQSAGAAQPSAGAAQLERELETAGKVAIYDIYFSFNSDRIREESAPRLTEIAEVLRKHPDWTLAVSGHTDSIGGASYNLDLSGRRAAAVKDALVKRYQIAPARLETAGFGASQPRDTNETLEGRARNRRVELVKR